jgi:phosphate transport system substrate-binding protein
MAIGSCRLLAISGLVALSMAAFIQISDAQAPGKKIIRVNGAGMASDQVNLWAKSFMEANQDVNLLVIGSSAGKGFRDLIAGNAEVAMMSRDISADEREKAKDKGIKLAEKPIGKAAVAVITSTRNPVSELTIEQIRKIYTGEYLNWKQAGGPDSPIRCLTRRVPESGGAVYFQSKAMNGQPHGPSAVFTETWETIMKVCSTAQDLPIGIVPHTRKMNDVKMIALKVDEDSSGVKATDEAVKSGTYPITLTFSFVWDQRLEDPSLLKFVDYCASQGLGPAAETKK